MKTMIAKALAGSALALATFGGIAGAVDDYCGTPYPGWPLPQPHVRLRLEPDPEPWRAVGSTVVTPGQDVGIIIICNPRPELPGQIGGINPQPEPPCR